MVTGGPKQGAYLLLLNVILILIFLPSVVASYCMSCSQMPFSWYVHEQQYFNTPS
jgi:hypothetical protein